MAWNEQYARILEQMRSCSSTGSAITGAESTADEPDCLFYTDFTRDTAVAFFDVFEAFKEYYKSNPTLGIERLKTNLKMQIDSMTGVCPIEVLLYSSRTIREYLGSRAIKTALITLIQQYIPNNLKSVQYILSGWEWPQLLCIVIEACGKTNNDEAVQLCIKYCPKIARKYIEGNDNEIIKSYITMIENTQNENYLDYLVQIVELPQFDEGNSLGDYLIKELKTNKFLKEHKEIIAQSIHPRTSNYSLKRNLDKLMDDKRRPEETGVLNFAGLNYDIKLRRIAAIDIISNPSAFLREFEALRESDRDIVILICKKVLSDIPSMRRSVDRNHAMIMIATKGGRVHAVELVDDILKLRESSPELASTTLIALAEINPAQYPMEDAMQQLLVDESIDSWSWALGKYLRYKKLVFEKILLRAISEKADSADSREMTSLLERFKLLIEFFNGNNDILSTQEEIQQAIFSIVHKVISSELSDSACITIIDLLDYMLKYNSKKSLEMLDGVKILAKSRDNQILAKVNEIISKGDSAREPD